RLQAPAAGLEIELVRDGLLPDRAVRADRERDPGRDRQVLARRDAQVFRRLTQVAELGAVLAGKLAQLGVVREKLVQAVLDVEPGLDARLQELSPLRREAAALGRDADECGRRLIDQRLLHRGDDRDAVERLAGPGRVDHHHRRIGRVADDSARRLAVVRVARATLSEYE